MLLHSRGEGKKKVRVVFRVFLHRRWERTARPIRLLRTFGERDVEILLNERGETELLQAQHPRRDHRVEDIADGQVVGATEQPQIEIHSLEHNFPLGQRTAQGLQINRRQRINEMILTIKGQLNQTKLFKIAMQAVGLGIDRDASKLCSRGRRSASCASDAITADPPVRVPRCSWSRAGS